ncbi:hypothetical protein Q7C36_021271 [Tachysurus vachellii]|uniref:Uncharacterized protein n=1 Tax=Tachysurus vachellii TaxID=175792 RepID=A0AA88IRU3_TACVA|nr:hypothetical protein Q7C36_021271 [Tachysurus vachellii]
MFKPVSFSGIKLPSTEQLVKSLPLWNEKVSREVVIGQEHVAQGNNASPVSRWVACQLTGMEVERIAAVMSGSRCRGVRVPTSTTGR